MPVYAFRKSGTDQVKIGVSINVAKRLSTLQHAAGAELSELHQVNSDAPYQVERELHQIYDPCRSLYGEWFDIPRPQEQQLIAQMDEVAAHSRRAIGWSKPGAEDEFLWLREPLAEAFAASLMTEEDLAVRAHVIRS